MRKFIFSLLLLASVALAAGPDTIALIGPLAPQITVIGPPTPRIIVTSNDPPAITINQPVASMVAIVTPGAQGPAGATLAGEGGGGTWGSIIGNLPDQTDLQAALDSKAGHHQNTTFGNLSAAKYKTGNWSLTSTGLFYPNGIYQPSGLDNTTLRLASSNIATLFGYNYITSTVDLTIKDATSGFVKWGTVANHIALTNNPHATTAAQLGLATVATTGSWADILLKPTIPEECVTIFDGKNATCTVGTTTTGAAGSSAVVTNSGTLADAVFNFTIPRGDTGAAGANGTAATIAVGTVTTGNAGTAVIVTNSGSSSAATFDFTIPKGDPGTNATVTTTAVLDALQGATDRALLIQSASVAEHTRLQINNSGGYLIVGVTDRGLVVVQNPAGIRLLAFDPVGKKLIMKTDSGRTIFSVMSSAAGGTLTL